MASRLARRAIASAVRRHALRDGAVWRIPVGLGQGLRVEVQPGQTASIHLYLGTAEAEIAPHIRRLVRPGMRCVDIGGNNAYYALIFARLSGIEVVSIDFAPDAMELAERNLSHNPELAGLVRLHRAYMAHESVPEQGAITLDELVADGAIMAPDLLKIDVEGSELSVLRGATEILRSSRPQLVIETHALELEGEIAQLLGGAGYRVTAVTQRRWLREGRPLAHNRWLVAEPPMSTKP